MKLRVLLIVAILAVAGGAGYAYRRKHAPTGPYRLQMIAQGFEEPVCLTHAGDGSGRVFVVEQKGRIREMKDGKPGPVYLDIVEKVRSGGEMGLLSIAFHPKFGTNGRAFVNYTTEENDKLFTIVSEFVNGDPKSERVILKIAQPYQNHNGGQNAFGPDGYLYVGMGDGGSGGDPHGNGQDTRALLGKMLRIDVDKEKPYAVPPDNPFVGLKGYRPEIWAYGLRNPWRFGFDRSTGALWCADVGQNSFEEIDVIVKGGNYGWNIMEGNSCFRAETCDRKGLILPVKDYGRKEGVCVTGGYVYRGKKRPELAGCYVYGDFGSGRIWLLKTDGGKVTEDRLLVDAKSKPISSFGEDEAGDLYVVTYEGRVWELVPAAAN